MLTFGKAGVVDPIPRFVDLAREMGPAVFFEHRVAEILDAQAQPRDAQLLERVDLRLRERARLALEGDFLGLVPIDVGPQAIDQRRELLARSGTTACRRRNRRSETAARPSPATG